MKLQTFLALKFLAGKRGNWILSTLTIMAIMGVVVSVMSFVVVEAVMTGFSKDLRSKILGFSSHIVLTLNPDYPDELSTKIQKLSGVDRVHQYIDGEAILRTEEGENVGIRIRGYDQERPPEDKELKISFEEGEGWGSLNGVGEDIPGILLGAELASSLGIVSALMERIEILFPFGEVGPLGEVEPNIRAFRVLGTFRSGYYNYDSKFAIMDKKDAKFLFGDSQPEKIGIFLKRPDHTEIFLPKLKELGGVDLIKTWMEQHARLFSALKLERIGMGLVLTLMMILASFNILSMIMMVVFERRRDIGVLRALGLSEGDIRKIFYRAGMGIGLLGSLMGILIGTGINWWLLQEKVSLPTPYYLEALPVEIRGGILLLILLVAPFICLVATYFPAREGGRLNVVESLRYE